MGNQEAGERELLIATKADPENKELLHILGTDDPKTGSLLTSMRKIFIRTFSKKKPDSRIAKKKLTEIFIVKGDLQKGMGLHARTLESATWRY